MRKTPHRWPRRQLRRRQPPLPPLAIKKKLSYKEQREFDGLPARIAALEAEQASVDKELGGGQLFNTDPARAAQLGARHADIEAEWLRAMERWEVLGGS